MIPFNRPPYTGNEEKYVLAAMLSDQMSGDGEFTQKCQSWFVQKLECSQALITPSCTHALEMAAILIDVKPGDEVIMPSYTFVSTANAFVLRGAKIVFVDIRPDTMNIDETLIEAAITKKTKSIVAVHYAGVACAMDEIMRIAEHYGLSVIEDAAQGMMSTYKGKPLGTIGDLGTYSFHETKNCTSGGEGGLLIINNEKYVERAEVIREKGTNRSQFFRGVVDKYSWVDVGSSYLPSELQAAYLWGQLDHAKSITENRLGTWRHYHAHLKMLKNEYPIVLPVIPSECVHNGHMFYIKARNLAERTNILAHLNDKAIYAVFHYVPLHNSPAGKRFSRFHGNDIHTLTESERLLRLPIWYGMEKTKVNYIVKNLAEYYAK